MPKKRKLELIHNIQVMINKMKLEYVLPKFFTLHKKIHDLPWFWIHDGYIWLLHIFNNEYKNYLEIKNCIPQSQWDAYKLFGVMDLREIKLFKEAEKKLNRVLKCISRPNFFKRTKINGHYIKIRKAKKRNARGTKT